MTRPSTVAQEQRSALNLGLAVPGSSRDEKPVTSTWHLYGACAAPG